MREELQPPTIQSYAVPLSLFRYRSLGASSSEGKANRNLLEREIGGLSKGEIFCPRYDELNDPMEGMYRATVLAKNKGNYTKLTNTIFDQKAALGIASLTESWNNDLMWAHYADQFYGICVRYDFKKMLSGLPEGCSLTRVLYCDKPLLMDSSTLRNPHISSRAALSAKSLSWAYEREWRLFKDGRGIAQFPPGVATAVYIGARIGADDKAQIREMLSGTSITVYETKVDGYSIKATKGQNGASA